MSDDNQPQEPLTDKDIDVLKSWSNVGAPGSAPTTPFIPSDEQIQKLIPIKMSRTIHVNWTFDQEAFKKLQFGHKAREMEDKWNIYLENNTVHFHRSWTGREIFRFLLQQDNDSSYSVSQFEVEQDSECISQTDEQALKNMLIEVLNAVVGVTVPSS